MNSKLYLPDFFNQIKSEIYCVIKMPENFPDYYKGSDIDLFCYDPEALISQLLVMGNKYIDNGYEISIIRYNNHIYIDFLIKSTIDFRFDIYSKLPEYRNVKIKPALFESIIENRILKKIKQNKINFEIFVPSEIDELILRYIEYHEWFMERPDKIKHIEYILNYFNNEPKIRFLFFKKLHHYVSLDFNYNTDVKSHKTNNKASIEMLLKKIFLYKIAKFLYKIFKYILNK